MPLRALIMISATVIASAVAVLPILGPAGPTGVRNAAPAPWFATVAAKGDRPRLLDPACTGEFLSAICADIYGVAEGPPPTLTVERRIGEATSVLIRLPVSQNARTWPVAIAEN
jgi:hypothetical protein